MKNNIKSDPKQSSDDNWNNTDVPSGHSLYLMSSLTTVHIHIKSLAIFAVPDCTIPQIEVNGTLICHLAISPPGSFDTAHLRSEHLLKKIVEGCANL